MAFLWLLTSYAIRFSKISLVRKRKEPIASTEISGWRGMPIAASKDLERTASTHSIPKDRVFAGPRHRGHDLDWHVSMDEAWRSYSPLKHNGNVASQVAHMLKPMRRLTTGAKKQQRQAKPSHIHAWGSPCRSLGNETSPSLVTKSNKIGYNSFDARDLRHTI